VSGGGTSLGYSTGLRGSAAASQVSGYADRTPSRWTWMASGGRGSRRSP